jgi:hypothetical protein
MSRAKPKPSFALVKQVAPEVTAPWQILESCITSDGWRTRVCTGYWRTEEEARLVLAELERKFAK